MKEEQRDSWFVLDETPAFFREQRQNLSVYRYISFDILLQMLNEKVNHLVKTSRWEDVYENFFLKETLKYNGRKVGLATMKDKFFGQCWTRKMASDAIWRIYSPDKKGVRIKTNLGKLFDIGLSFPGDESGNCLLGKVVYLPQVKIEGDLRSLNRVTQDDLAKILLQSFFVKRDHFSHEAEYRLIFASERPIKADVISMRIDPFNFIENIYFDPRADDNYVKRCTEILVAAFNYPRDRIHKSSLYAFNPLEIEVV